MASVLIPIIPLQPISRASTFSPTFSYASTLMTATRAVAVISATSGFVLSPTAGGSARRPTSESSQTIALAIVVPLIALIAFISVIVFRMYRSRKEREEAAAANAARAKTRAIEQQIYDLESISEKLNLKKYRATLEVKEVGNGKDISMDIPIELEADEPDKKRYHGL
ncbi:hypothetical protein PMIN06_006229 [Paraphaeosphaeria minitans]|uniref:Uncharacterized protein n=1 Tax=Paraphaeosphaeria minitans TaxID=565426 RepID=A0A9P6GUH6_9PLEO|nr:hypothetical protein PMIN01_01322 [Paraphaeosphaeria minitans]